LLEVLFAAMAFGICGDVPGQVKVAEPGAECCTPEAMKQVAGTLGFTDILGIQLGMTPEQALVAAKKANPNLKFHVIKARMESPGAPGGFVEVPRYIVAGTQGVPKFASFPAPFTLADGSADEIVLEFTIPPSPPLLAKIARRVTFATGQPVMASVLIEAAEKKYGKENLNANNSLYWIFDASGKLSGFSWQSGSLPAPGDDLVRPAPEPVNLSTTTTDINQGGLTERVATCQGVTIFQAFELGGNVSPNTRKATMETTLQSGSLLYMSRPAAHEWIQAKQNALKKGADDAAKQRSAPKM
jgi:hypothetical protein